MDHLQCRASAYLGANHSTPLLGMHVPLLCQRKLVLYHERDAGIAAVREDML